jgi:hypothetical protein
MTYRELKESLGTLTEDQLNQPAIFFKDDDETGTEIDNLDISQADVYWFHHGECLGNLKDAMETLGDEWENEKDDLIIAPAGTVTLHNDF